MSTYPSPSPRTGTPTLEGNALKVRILELRKQGVSFPQIAHDLGIERRGEPFTQGYIYKMYKLALKAIIFEDVNEVRKIELMRLDEMEAILDRELARHHYVINSGAVVRDVVDDENGQPLKDEEGNYITKRIKDSEPVMKLVAAKLKVQERRAKLLGLDAPTKISATDPTGEKSAPVVQFYIPNNGRDGDVSS